MIVDNRGYRLNVGIILCNEKGLLFWGRRIGHDAWQFPQGGVNVAERAGEAMYRELGEEIGLQPSDVKILSVTQRWLRYKLPEQYMRRNNSRPSIVGQKQKWFLLQLMSSDQKIRLDLNNSPEFDSWRWVEPEIPPKEVIYFKRQVYARALQEFAPILAKLK